MRGSRQATGIRAAVAAMAALAALAGCRTGGAPAVPPPQEAGGPSEYVIGVGDVLNVTVWQNERLTAQGVPVRSDGKISIPLLDDVQAAGLTPRELKEVITQALTEYVVDPDVTVTVVQPNSQRVFVMGAVARPGPVALFTRMRVLDALSAAGGFTTFADRDDIRVLRREDGGVREYRFDYDAFVSGKAPESNFVLAPGDTIIVPD